MNTLEVRNKLIVYMKENKIPIAQVAQATKINLKKLETESKKDLTAAELCEICNYLNVDPKLFYKEKIFEKSK